MYKGQEMEPYCKFSQLHPGKSARKYGTQGSELTEGGGTTSNKPP